jgi:sodium-coupled neutral amino acid transporter 11
MTCDLGVVLEIAGGLSATALAFIVSLWYLCEIRLCLLPNQFPASAYFVLTKGPWYSRAKLPAVICTVFGIIVLTLSCGLTVMKAVSGEGTTKQC